MALSGRRSVWVMIALLALVALLGWAWADGGERPLSEQSAPALLPQVAR